MSDILIPDFGGDEADVIEVLVKVGDSVATDDSLLVLETDKASVEVPAPSDGTIGDISVAVGDKVSEGQRVMGFSGADTEAPQPVVENQQQQDTEVQVPEKEVVEVVESADSTEAQSIALSIPDLGTDNAEVIEVSVSIGDSVAEGDTLAVIETDKASIEIPAEIAGEIESIAFKVGDSIQTGGDLVTIKSMTVSSKVATSKVEEPKAEAPKSVDTNQSATSESVAVPASASQPNTSVTNVSHADVHAGPAVRQLARKLGVDLANVVGTGPRGRVLQEDLHSWVKQQLGQSNQDSQASNTTTGSGIPSVPAVDYSKFGEITLQSMTKIHKVTAANMHRSWLNVPHVTQFDDADITDLETYRNSLKPVMKDKGIKVTPVAFLIKAAGLALQKNPKFNISLHEDGEHLVQRHFVNIGMAVATPAGLVVPVIRDVNQKSIWAIASDIAELSAKARDGKLSLKEMQGGCFTISSLGAIGGTGFTPIVNTPEVGILGISKSRIMPDWDGKQFVPRNKLPLALSYDHRAINGADAGKFLTEFVERLIDISNFPS